MYYQRSFFRLVIFSTLLLISFSYKFLYSQNYWERTSGPGTVTIYDFVFVNNLILCGTWHGGMYKSTDRGETWKHMENEFSSSSVRSLELLSNGNIIAGTGSGIHLSSDNGENWFHSSLSDEAITTFEIDSTGTIYTGSLYSSNVFRSTDNGLNWVELDYNWTYSGVSDIEVKNLNTILISAGRIYRSSDYGITWDTIFISTNGVADIELNSVGDFFAVTYEGKFYKSVDDGITWTHISNLPLNSGRKIFVSPNGYILAGGYGIFRSTDGGISWDTSLAFSSSGSVREIIRDGNEIYAGTYLMGAHKSTDQGIHWIPSNKGLNHSNVSYLVRDFNGRIISHGYFGSMAFTTDNGSNWSLLSPMGLLNSFSASSNGSLFASQSGAYFGVILRSTNNGYNWETIFRPGFDTTVTQVNVNIDAIVYAIIKGKLYKSLNNGDDWELIQITSENERVNKIYFNSVGMIFIRSSEGYFRSSDNGETWEKLNSTPYGLNIFGITQSDEMYAAASDSGYYRSTDYGENWEFVFDGSGKTIKAFASNDIGYLFISVLSLGVFRSTDNGYSWQEINDGLDSSSVNALIVTDDDYLLAGTSWKGVYRSVNKTTSVENYFVEIPKTIYLNQNYPNPFNPTTNIQYSVSGRQFVSLKIYDVLGNEVAILIDEEKSPGIYKVEFDGAGLSSGIYFYQLRTGSFTQTRKMVLLK